MATYTNTVEVRREAGLTENFHIGDEIVGSKLLDAEDEINGTLVGSGYSLPLVDEDGEAYTPPTIKNIVKLLAAGFLLTQDYGPTVPMNTKEGMDKVNQARDLLKQIQERKIILLGPDNEPLMSSDVVDGWPNDDTATAGADGSTPEPAQITMGKKF